MVTGKCTDVFTGILLFRGRFEGGVTWEDISVEKLVMGEENFNDLEVLGVVALVLSVVIPVCGNVLNLN